MPVYVLHTDSMTTVQRYERSPRILLATDGDSGQPLPPEFTAAADSVRHADISAWRQLPSGHDGVMIWLSGDRLLHSDSYALRHHFLHPGHTYYVPVHLPCLPDADLIGIQPRWQTHAIADRVELIAQRWRIAANPSPSPLARQFLEQTPAPWARLHLALLAACASPADGLTRLAPLWQPGLPDWLGALVIRNLAVLLWRLGHHQELETLWREAMQKYPGYAEIPYLTARWHLQHGRVQPALESAQAAIDIGREKQDSDFVGSGGEASYRAQHLFGFIAEQLGNQQAAFVHYVPGIRHVPAFPPSVEGILRQQLPPHAAESVQWDLRRMARRERQYTEDVFDFFLRHRLRSAARVILDTFDLPDHEREPMETRWQATFSSPARKTGPSVESNTIRLRGPLFSDRDASAWNRQIGKLLSSLTGTRTLFDAEDFYRAQVLPPDVEKEFHAASRPISPADVLTIAHPVLPELETPLDSHPVLVIDWPWSAFPRAWLTSLNKHRGEVWVFSQLVKDLLVRSGIPAEQIRHIVLPIDSGIFHPAHDGERAAQRPCTLLFWDECVESSGIDALLRAFALAFRADDPVLLLFQTPSGSPADREHDLFATIQAQAAPACRKQILFRKEFLTDTACADLLRSCDALVLPGRKMPSPWKLAAAAHCGVPVLCTGNPRAWFDPHLELNPVRASTQLAPASVQCRHDWSEPVVWFEPDIVDLACQLRSTFEQIRHLREASDRMATKRIQEVNSARTDEFNRQLLRILHPEAAKSARG